jgi:hypothetical protein
MEIVLIVHQVSIILMEYAVQMDNTESTVNVYLFLSTIQIIMLYLMDAGLNMKFLDVFNATNIINLI